MAHRKKNSAQAALPLVPATIAPKVVLTFNQLVTLKGDNKFRGYIFGQMRTAQRGHEYLISIKEQGRTGKRGCQFFPADQVIPATSSKGGEV